ncbi:MAG: DUF1028 domain-containing protein [Anaerolineales bacterium]|nr:DUF1028 domain-containing protein [Anaerolineales bacterium]
MVQLSTFSIVTYDPSDSSWGVAVASKFPAVGAVVPWAKAGVGAVATQSFANTSFGPHGLDMMASGISAQDTLTRLLEEDSDREHRQVGLVDASGNSSTFTGKNCYNWAGGLIGPGYAIQGNILSGAGVVHAMEKAYLEMEGNLPARLHAALLAGDRAGGDRRGRQSAAILVVKPNSGYGGFNDRWIDYRVDDAEDPVSRLGELLKLHWLYFGKSPESEHVQLAGEILIRLKKIMARLGYFHPTTDSSYDEKTKEAFRTFIGNENFEERSNPDDGWIDKPVLDYLFNKFGG